MSRKCSSLKQHDEPFLHLTNSLHAENIVKLISANCKAPRGWLTKNVSSCFPRLPPKKFIFTFK